MSSTIADGEVMTLRWDRNMYILVLFIIIIIIIIIIWPASTKPVGVNVETKQNLWLQPCLVIIITCSTCYRRQAIPMEQAKIRPSVTLCSLDWSLPNLVSFITLATPTQPILVEFGWVGNSPQFGDLSVTFVVSLFSWARLEKKTHERIWTINGSKREIRRVCAFWGFHQKIIIIVISYALYSLNIICSICLCCCAWRLASYRIVNMTWDVSCADYSCLVLNDGD